jgi:elongation factor Ts
LRRLYSSQPHGEKPSLKLVAELRKLTEVSISKAREALEASQNDVAAALEWLKADLATSGAKKAAKVDGRTVNEGLISTCVLNAGGFVHAPRAAMVELNCETDFVGRNDLFGALASDVARTTAFFAEQLSAGSGETFRHVAGPEEIESAPLVLAGEAGPSASETVGSRIRETIAKVGEKIALRRAFAIAPPSSPYLPSDKTRMRVGSYLHGAIRNSPDLATAQGRIGTLVDFSLSSPTVSQLLSSDNQSFLAELSKMERAIARQVVGLRAQTVTGSDDSALYSQPWLAAEVEVETVLDALRRWSRDNGVAKTAEEGGLEVLGFTKWTVGEPVEL